MLYTEETVKSNIRNREGKRVFYLGKKDQLTSGARDYLARQRIEILSADQAKPDRYRLSGGGYAEEKPEHMTHLRGDVLVPKCHPVIAFRGKLDSFQGELILAQLEIPGERQRLGEILAFSRNLIRCDVMQEPVAMEKLCGLTEQELRSRSHFPQDYYAKAHFMPEAADGMKIARLNRLRCFARETELAAADAFRDRDGNCTREDILRALNRMSSMLYIMMIENRNQP